MDELPMIYVASYCCAILFDTSRGFSLQDSNAKELGIIFTVFAQIGRPNLTFTVNAAVALVGFAVLLLARFPPDGATRWSKGEAAQDGRGEAEASD